MNTTPVAAPGLSSVFQATFSALIAGMSIIPQTVGIVAVNLDTIHRYSVAGNMYAQDTEADAEINHEIRVIALKAKRDAALANKAKSITD